jgi:hypothetical protein
MMGPPNVDEKKQKFIEEKAQAVVEALSGVSVADVGAVFMAAQGIIMNKCKV